MNFLPILFFISFVFSVVNLSIGGTSVYFYMFIPFFDFRYIIWVCKGIKLQKVLFPFTLLVFFMVINFINTQSLIEFIKPIILMFSVGYCVYLYNHRYAGFKWLYIFVSISVLFSCLQFFLSSVGVGEFLEPTKIANFIWGGYAIQARSGFDDGFLFPYRVSGLSKEPGFFSSLLLSCFVLYMVDKKLESKLFVMLLFLGLVLSLSKITIAFAILVPMVFVFNRYVCSLDRVNIIFGGFLYVVSAAICVNYIYSLTGFIDITYATPYFAETYLHRSIGFYILGFPLDENVLNSILIGGATQNLRLLISSFPFIINLKFVDIQPDVVFFSSSGAYILLQYGIGVFINECRLVYIICHYI